MQNKLNILFISKYAAPPTYSYVPSRPFYLGSEIIKMGHNFTVITSDSNHLAKFPNVKKVYNFDQQQRVPFYWIKTKKYKKSESISRVISWIDFEIKLFLFKKIINLKPQVIIISSLSIFTILYGYYLSKKTGSILVFEIRDIWPLTMIEEGGYSKYNPFVWLLEQIEKFGYCKANLISGTMSNLSQHVNEVIGREKKIVIFTPLGFLPDIKDTNSSDINNPFQIYVPKGKIIVGYAGSLGLTNALDSFVNTIKLMSDIPTVHFMIIGDGSNKKKYQEQLRTCHNITFFDRVEHGKIKYFLEVCDILYLSTKDSKVWDYGQSMNKMVDYMLAAKPIIARYSGYPTMLNEANCGVFIKPDDPQLILKQIMAFASIPKADLEKMGKKGRDWIYNNRTYEKLAYDYISSILQIIK